MFTGISTPYELYNTKIWLIWKFFFFFIVIIISNRFALLCYVDTLSTLYGLFITKICFICKCLITSVGLEKW